MNQLTEAEMARRYMRMCQAMKHHESGDDMLGRMNPKHWHYCDIRVRINGQTIDYDGGWLKDLLYARDADSGPYIEMFDAEIDAEARK